MMSAYYPTGAGLLGPEPTGADLVVDQITADAQRGCSFFDRVGQTLA
jgi:hypothetical protein